MLFGLEWQVLPDSLFLERMRIPPVGHVLNSFPGRRAVVVRFHPNLSLEQSNFASSFLLAAQVQITSSGAQLLRQRLRAGIAGMPFLDSSSNQPMTQKLPLAPSQYPKRRPSCR